MSRVAAVPAPGSPPRRALSPRAAGFWAGRRGRAAVLASFLVLMAGLIAVPVREYLVQRADVAGQEAQLARLRAGNERLEARIERLSDPAEIERIARRDYGLVRAGEESYSVLPPDTAGLVLPRTWPFDRLADALRSTAFRR